MQLFRVQGLIATSLGRVFCAKSTSSPPGTRANQAWLGVHILSLWVARVGQGQTEIGWFQDVFLASVHVRALIAGERRGRSGKERYLHPGNDEDPELAAGNARDAGRPAVHRPVSPTCQGLQRHVPDYGVICAVPTY